MNLNIIENHDGHVDNIATQWDSILGDTLGKYIYIIYIYIYQKGNNIYIYKLVIDPQLIDYGPWPAVLWPPLGGCRAHPPRRFVVSGRGNHSGPEVGKLENLVILCYPKLLSNSVYPKDMIPVKGFELLHIDWLVVAANPSEKHEFVSWDYEISNIWKNNTCSKPPTS